MTDQTFPPFELPKTEMPKKRRGRKPRTDKKRDLTPAQKRSVSEHGHAEGILMPDSPAPEFITSLIKMLDSMHRDNAIDIVKLLTRIYA